METRQQPTILSHCLSPSPTLLYPEIVIGIGVASSEQLSDSFFFGLYVLSVSCLCGYERYLFGGFRKIVYRVSMAMSW